MDHEKLVSVIFGIFKQKFLLICSHIIEYLTIS